MSDIIETYQEEESLKKAEPKEICYATVKTISSSGINVQFDGETTESTKAYSFNVAGQFQVNDRVLMQKVNGEYVAMATIGKSGRSSGGKTFTVTTQRYGRWSVSSKSVYKRRSSFSPTNFMGIVGVRVEIDDAIAIASTDGSNIEIKVYNNSSSSISTYVYIDYLTWEES